MKFTSTRNNSVSASFEEALYQGSAPDKGLYVPSEFPRLPDVFFNKLKEHSLGQISEAIMTRFITEIPPAIMKVIINQTLNFPIPLIHLENNFYLLEVFHGPTLAFKDIGARFMANTLAYFMALEHKEVAVVVATSGDTGSAIAQAFYNVPHIDVYILYPSKKISALQEKQMTTLGGNIHALEVAGTFDDCQLLVKTALADDALKSKRLVTTANSINIARLLPQIIYHGWGLAQLKQQGVEENPDMVVPSGNLGNLTSAVYARAIGFSVNEFVAATNVNAVFPGYLKSGKFTPVPSRQTYANAMDVGNPSNFERLLSLYKDDHEKMQKEVKGIVIDDQEILAEIKRTYEKSGYILDPHTAVGVAAARRHNQSDRPVIITATAHPAKFPDVIKRAINIEIELPAQLRLVVNRPEKTTKISASYIDLQNFLKR